jgi:hypothetical protein
VVLLQYTLMCSDVCDVVISGCEGWPGVQWFILVWDCH